MIGQVAPSTVLLFISMLFLRSLSFIGTVNPGFDLEHVVTAHIDLDRDRYPVEQRLALGGFGLFQDDGHAVAARPRVHHRRSDPSGPGRGR